MIKGRLTLVIVRLQNPAVLDVNDPIGEGLETRIVGDADHGGVVLNRRAAEKADDDLAVFAI